MYSGIRADGSGRRYGRSSASRGAARALRVSSTTARANRRYAASSAKSRSPPQQQRLLDGRFRPEVRLLRDAVLVRLPRLDPRRAQPVVVQHLPEPHRQLTTAAAPQLVRRRRQVVVTKHRRNRTQRPHRALQARHQRLERLAQRQRHIRPPAVAQHPLEQQVRERDVPQRHPQVARVAEVERCFPTRNRHLLEVHLAIGTVLNPPLSDPPLQRPQLSWLEPTRMPPAQCPEQRQHLQPAVGVGHQLRHNLGLPHVGERVLPRPPRPRRLHRRRQRPALPLPGRTLAHPGRRRGRRQRLPCHPLLSQPPNLRVRDQPVLHQENGQCHTSRGRLPRRADHLVDDRQKHHDRRRSPRAHETWTGSPPHGIVRWRKRDSRRRNYLVVGFDPSPRKS